MTTQFRSPEELLAAQGQPLGVTDWLEITQERVNLFAEATGDHQWIHVDPERAKDGPFGGCIAHGYLTLSLVNLFLPQLIEVVNLKMGVNVGCERIRFPARYRWARGSAVVARFSPWSRSRARLRSSPG
ncbi:MaoC family dehydratase [Halomonas sp. PR-M31]|uniref:MaoC family dehydratase n=1 Tax=Halomonas sp. PR-M31 TaxID=1471202 RepID=UPI000B22DC4D|nr:MaoC family dehydratase [Halomonas sp. PR-M31]